MGSIMDIESRIWNQEEVAIRLHMSSEWFRQQRNKLEAQGFPQKNKLLGGWDAKAIELWLDQMAGLKRPENYDEDDCLKAIKGYES